VSTGDNWWTEGGQAWHEAKRLNEGIAKRKGWVVAIEAIEVIDHPRLPGGAAGPAHGFQVRQKDAPASSAQSFATGEEVEAFLAELPDAAE
jgi:hypothetical protein